MVQPRDPFEDDSWREEIETPVHDEEETATRPLRLVRGEVEDRPDVRLGPDVHRVIDDAVSGLSRDARIFQRTHELVTVIGAREEEGAKAPFTPGSPIIRPLNSAALLPRLTRHIRFVTRRKVKDEFKWINAVPPQNIVTGILAEGEWPGIRHLRGVTETPVLRPDGTVLQTAGYDPQTGYFFRPNAGYPEVEEAPSKEQAADALKSLLHVFCDFPYASAHHAAVPIAAILSVLARPAILGAVPAFLFDASTRGSGKTLQCDVVSLIALGRTAARANFPEKDEELEKVLAAYAIAGSQVILLDNITRPLGGGALDAVLTCRDDVEFRLLGKHETKRLPWRAVIMASGNNLVLGDDTTRRCMVARLESPLENPEERTDFQHADLVQWVKQWRPTLVHAALTILRAYTAAGLPKMGPTRWGSFEEWSDLVPGALLFAGGADPMLARATQASAMSDSRRALMVLIEGLRRLSPDRAISARTMLSSLYPDRDHHDGPLAPDGYEDLRDTIEAETGCPSGRKPEAKRLGKWLLRSRGRVVNGWHVERVDGPNHTACWRAVSAG